MRQEWRSHRAANMYEIVLINCPLKTLFSFCTLLKVNNTQENARFTYFGKFKMTSAAAKKKEIHPFLGTCLQL